MTNDDLPEIPEPSPQHYSGEHLPAQNEPGQHAPIPVSRTPWERPIALGTLFFRVGRLRRNARSWHNDGEWLELEPELKQWLWKLFDDYKMHGMQPALWDDISWVRFYLHMNPLPRDMMVWGGPEKNDIQI